MKPALHHQARMRRVLEHIEHHLHQPLNLDELSRVAACSKFHFHRQFSATFGLSVQRYIQLARMKRASYQLAYRAAHSVTGVALDAGYAAPDAFARAFRQRFGQSPSSFRLTPHWQPWLAALEPLNHARSTLMHPVYNANDVTIRTVPATPVGIMSHRGDPALLGATVQRFIAWRRAAGLHPKNSPTFNVWYSERQPASPDDYHVDLCAGTRGPIEAHGAEVVAGEIPGGRCAVLRVTGHTDNLEPAALFLYRDWLPASGETTRDFPVYCQRIKFFPEVPEHETVAEVFLPLR